MQSQGIWKARSHMSQIQDKERSNSFGLCTHPDVRNYRGNIHVCTRLSGTKPRISLFFMFLGMVKDTSKDKKWSIWANESAVGQGKAIQCVIHLVW